jgi:hypothetical protein
LNQTACSPTCLSNLAAKLGVASSSDSNSMDSDVVGEVSSCIANLISHMILAVCKDKNASEFDFFSFSLLIDDF